MRSRSSTLISSRTTTTYAPSKKLSEKELIGRKTNAGLHRPICLPDPSQLARLQLPQVRLKLFGDVAVVYDGRKNLFSPEKLKGPGWSKEGEKRLEVVIPEVGDEEGAKKGVGRKYTVKVRFTCTDGISSSEVFFEQITKVAEVNLHALHAFLRGESGPTPDEGVLMSMSAHTLFVSSPPLTTPPQQRSERHLQL